MTGYMKINTVATIAVTTFIISIFSLIFAAGGDRTAVIQQSQKSTDDLKKLTVNVEGIDLRQRNSESSIGGLAGDLKAANAKLDLLRDDIRWIRERIDGDRTAFDLRLQPRNTP